MALKGNLKGPDGSSGSIFPYNERTYIGASSPFDITPLQVANRVYIANNVGNSVTIYNMQTSKQVASVALTSASKMFYIASKKEIWVSSTSLTTLTRIDADPLSGTFDTVLGTITGVGASVYDAYEYSTTKVFLAGFGTNNVYVVNPVTNTITATITAATLGGNSVYNFCYNDKIGSLHFGKLIALHITPNNALTIINPVTNTVTAGALNVGGLLNDPRGVVYLASVDKYFITNKNTNSVLVYQPLTATTFSFVTEISGIYNPIVIQKSTLLDKIYVSGMETFNTTTGNQQMHIINPTSYLVEKKHSTSAVGSSGSATFLFAHVLKIDDANGYIYATAYYGQSIGVRIKIR